MSQFSVRFARPSDAKDLLRLEKQHFPPTVGQPHGGYVYAKSGILQTVLNEKTALPARQITLVAEDGGKVVGFAAASALKLPGWASGVSCSSMLLQYVAVDISHRKQNIGRELVQGVEERALSVTPEQAVIVAHVPSAQAKFYSNLGWQLGKATYGFAWQPISDHLCADIPDPHLGFPILASKVLRPEALVVTFPFEDLRRAPLLDAALALDSKVKVGFVNRTQLPDSTHQMISFALTKAVH